MAGLERAQIEEYLTGLGMGRPLVDQALSAVEDAQKVLPGEVEGVFVTEYRDEEGNRHYENLWLFAPGYISELRNFLSGASTAVGFDIVSVRPGLARIDVERENFDFETASEQSRLRIDLSFPPSKSVGIGGTLRATGDNCGALTEILRERLVPLL